MTTTAEAIAAQVADEAVQKMIARGREIALKKHGNPEAYLVPAEWSPMAREVAFDAIMKAFGEAVKEAEKLDGDGGR